MCEPIAALDAGGQGLLPDGRLAGSLSGVLNTDLYTSDSPKFVAFDRLPDAHAPGPVWLRRPEIAALLMAALRRRKESNASNWATGFIMPNHVHVLLYPNAPVANFVGSIKRFTAREANRMLGCAVPFLEKRLLRSLHPRPRSCRPRTTRHRE